MIKKEKFQAKKKRNTNFCWYIVCERVLSSLPSLLGLISVLFFTLSFLLICHRNGSGVQKKFSCSVVSLVTWFGQIDMYVLTEPLTQKKKLIYNNFLPICVSFFRTKLDLDEKKIKKYCCSHLID